ncbi:hypothetical protein B4147_3007 [Bacillus wiedmannii]|uniref:Uncharacterized protein n=1 Tax=Bacillus wiedmannii TaxID=1890302 RepID=A0A0G8CCF5_9BACI|nr:hypothetical protein B4147_3007 [Bacillus wiedmannii]
MMHTCSVILILSQWHSYLQNLCPVLFLTSSPHHSHTIYSTAIFHHHLIR